jgi:uncharacterized protein (TIGR02271 family)
MSDETIVAVFETGAHADAAVRALESAGVESSAIERHSKQGEPGNGSDAPAQGSAPQGTGFFFWDMMFGGQGSHQDRPTYERSVARGETILAVTVSARQAETVMAVLEDQSPIELDERVEEESEEDVAPERASRAATRETEKGEQVIPLSEEELQVGKRTVNRGTTRIRRYVVEAPVEQAVSLRDEKVSVERRRPVTDDATGDAFTEKTVEVTETSEVPVAEKVARLKEEVVVRKEGAERTETVKDTVRRDRVAVEDTMEAEPARRGSEA